MITPAQIRDSIVAWWGHAQHASSWNLLQQLLNEHPFVRRSQQESEFS